MKHLFRLSLLAVAITALASCSSDSINEPEAPDASDVLDVVAARSYSQRFSNGSTMTIYTGERPRKAMMASRAGENPVNVLGNAPALTNDDMNSLYNLFITEFPAGKPNLTYEHTHLQDFSSDFEMVSNGKPFCIYPVMVGGNARNIVGVSYFDGEEYHDVDLIDLTADEVIGNPGNGWYCIQDGNGVQLQIPYGTPFQLYLRNQHAHGTSMHGTNFYSSADRNYNNQLHAVTYRYDDMNFIGFEDLDLTAGDCDKDYNDVILMITPWQRIIREIQLTIPLNIDKELLCEVDDFALSNNVERYPEDYNIGSDPDRKIVINRLGELNVLITDFDNLTFDEQYQEWTYESWIWLCDPAVTEGHEGDYLIGSPEKPDYSYSRDNYRVGVSAFLGNQAQGTAGYVKVSVHISLLKPED